MIFLPCIISGLSKNRTKLIGLHVAQTQTMKFFSLFQQGNILKIDTKKSMLLGRHEILFEKCKNLLTVSKCEQCKDFKSRVLVNGTCISSAYQIANAKWRYIAKCKNNELSGPLMSALSQQALWGATWCLLTCILSIWACC